ncbi:MAG: RdgB/HAM1 family non-canonical purine NTP pyrophosphatase [Clostridiales bacterium]|nr:RdgB/HAM1 family non-canonical purine NTP pyrophosphatase [Clostridiales bacterium]
MRLLVASSNPGKIREIRRLLKGGPWEILSLGDLAALWRCEELGGLPPAAGDEAEVEKIISGRYAKLHELMEETGATFEENAVIKARGAAGYTGILSLADDSGLEVDWLDGAPGVYSARYAGPEGDEQACNALLLERMRNAPAGSRSARYVAVIVLASPEIVLHTAYGICEGQIGFAPKGSGGFGYDPLFLLPASDLSMAELSMEDKNNISHRGKALAQTALFLADFPAD